jgi:predicted Zn-dependent protease
VLLSDKGDYAKAADLQTKALALQPANPLFKLNLAKIHIKGGKKDLAKKELDELVKLGDKFGGQAEVSALLKGM